MHIKEKCLEKTINRLRSEMIKSAQLTGINSIDTIACSQELDKLINVAMKSKKDLHHTNLFNSLNLEKLINKDETN